MASITTIRSRTYPEVNTKAKNLSLKVEAKTKDLIIKAKGMDMLKVI